MGRTGWRLECRERVRWGEQDGEDRKEVRVPGGGQVGGTGQGRLECREDRKEVRVPGGGQVGEQDGEDRKEVRVPGGGQVGGTGWGGQEGG